MKIRNTILLSFVILAIIGSFAGGVYFYYITSSVLIEQVEQHLETATASRAKNVETLLNGYYETALTFATGIPFREAVNPDMNRSKKMAIVNRRIKSIIKTHPQISRILVLDKNGTVIASNYENVGQYLGNKEIFLKGQKAFYFEPIHTSRFTGNSVLSTAAPIQRDSKFSGVLILDFNSEELAKITTDRTGLGKTGDVYLINKDGYMITPSRFATDTFLKLKVDTIGSKDCLAHGATGFEPGHHKEIKIYPDYRSVTVLGTHKYIPEMQWCLLAEKDKTEAIGGPVKKLIQTSVIAIMLIIIFVGLAGYFISGRITKPIKKLQKATEEFEKGKFNRRVQIKTKDEMAQLGRAFNKMAAGLEKADKVQKRYHKKLEEEIAKKTKDLQNKLFQLETFARVSTGREKKMIELKEKIKKLEEETETMGAGKKEEKETKKAPKKAKKKK